MSIYETLPDYGKVFVHYFTMAEDSIKISYSKLTEGQKDAICKWAQKSETSFRGCRKYCPLRFFTRHSSLCLRDIDTVVKINFKVNVPKEILDGRLGAEI